MSSQVAYNRQWNKDNRDKRLQHERTHRQNKREWLKELKHKLFCIKCGKNHIACLDFHHKNPVEKDMGIAKMLYRWSKKKIEEEIAKCDVLCSNCHRKEHYGLL